MQYDVIGKLSQKRREREPSLGSLSLIERIHCVVWVVYPHGIVAAWELLWQDATADMRGYL